MLSEILDKYKDKQPMDLVTAVERTYPVSAVIDMMAEFATYKNEVQIEAVSNWLMLNTKLSVEQIVDLKMAMKI